MADLDLAQAEADALIAMEKHYVEEKEWEFPEPGDRVAIPLASADKRESFVLDITRVQVKLTKATYQNRARSAVILLRLDIDGGSHRNPDGEDIPCPHIHIYREGFADKWAFPLPANIYSDASTFGTFLDAFMGHCNITQPPIINMRLF